MSRIYKRAEYRSRTSLIALALWTAVTSVVVACWLLLAGPTVASPPDSPTVIVQEAYRRPGAASTTAWAQTRETTATVIQSMVDAVSQDNLADYIQHLQDDPDVPGLDAQGTRYTYSSGLSTAAEYISQHFASAGLTVDYNVRTWFGTRITNVVGTLPGLDPTSDEIIIVGAHYDSRSNDPLNTAPGADDNASGTAVVMEVARVLGGYRFGKTVRFITFGGEEQGLLGSAYYAWLAAGRGDNITGMINLDMVGWDGDGDRVMEVHAGMMPASVALADDWKAALAEYSLNLVPQTWISGATTASDHAAFWAYGYPAVLLIEDASGPDDDFNPFYHSTADTFDKLDMSYAVDFARATVATLAELAEPWGINLSVSKSGPDVTFTGSNITYTLTYTNAGTEQALDVVLTDTFTTGLTYVGDSSGFAHTEPFPNTLVWALGDVATDTAHAFVVTMTVASGLPSGSVVTNTLAIGSASLDPVPEDDSVTASTVVCVHRLEDVDWDTDVDVNDIMAVAVEWRQGVAGDVDGDGDTDIVDVQRTAAAWGADCT